VVFRIASTPVWQQTDLQAEAGPGCPEAGDPRRLGVSGDEWRDLAHLGVIAFAALCFALGHWLLSGHPAAGGWLATVIAALVVPPALVWHERRLPNRRPDEVSPWFLRHRWPVGALSLAWGALPLWVGNEGGHVAELWTVMVLMIGAVVGAHALAADRWAMGLWLLPLPAPLIGVALWQGTTESRMIAALVLAFMGSAFFFALQRHQLLEDAARTKSSNDALVRELRQQVSLVEQANRDKSRFVAAASHDLRQPMHALGLFAASLEKSLADSPLLPTVIHMMKAVDALEQSCSAMLDLSKLDAGVVAPNTQSFPIRDIFRRLHMHCAGQAEELGLGLRFKPGGKIVTSDPQLLERVLANLIHNAIRYTREGGIVVLARTRADRISLEVWDTGIGIPEAELPRIFDEFYQVSNSGRDRARGLGMGLAIVKRLVMLMGHELEVRSHVGKGTVFRILLAPTELADMNNMVLGAETVPELIDVNRTALVIDDEESIRVGMRDLLQSWGFEVLLAESIPQACSEVSRHAGVIDIVLSDLRLANKEDGIAAIERVRAVYGAPLPAVLITGDTSADEVRRAHESGHQVLFKPVRPRELYSLLRGVP